MRRKSVFCLLGLLVLAAPGVEALQEQETRPQQDQPPPVFESRVDAEGDAIEIKGYADFRKGGIFIADGQRIRIYADTVIEGEVMNPADIELGFEFKAVGPRLANGMILARMVEAKPNDGQMMESQVAGAANAIEREWVQAGYMYESEDRPIGPIVTYDDRVKRVHKIMARLLPPYVHSGDVRVYVVETELWNASALANGSIWVFTGLIDSANDDELAIILGHELAHFTYEHSRRAAKDGMWKQALAGLGSSLLAGLIGRGTVGDVVSIASLLGTQAWINGYSRDLEDQADRVGLRYAYEGGYNVWAGPGLWQRFKERFGQSDAMSNYILGGHSTPDARIENIEREIEINYRHEEKEAAAESAGRGRGSSR